MRCGLEMSNKFRNNLLQAVFILTFLLLCPNVSAFDPGDKDFQSKYQYELYRSWLSKGKFRTNYPSVFTSEKIVKTFFDENNQPVNVEYDWDKHLITAQRETAGYLFFAGDAQRIWSIVKYIEGFIYRLNTQNRQFLTDYVDLEEMEIYYSDLTADSALDKLWEDFDQQRIRFHPIEIEETENTLLFLLNPVDGESFKLGFPMDFDLQEEIKKITKLERKRSTETDLEEYPSITEVEIIHKEPEKDLVETSLPEVEEMIKEPIHEEPGELASIQKLPRKIYEEKPVLKDYDDLPQKGDLELAEYIQNFIGQKHSRELLNNKISDPLSFLNMEFPNREISFENESYRIAYPPLRGEFHCDLNLKIEIDNDGINIFPENYDYYFQEEFMVLSEDEKINLGDLNDDEISSISPFIPQLVYEHRSLGSKLLNFLLIHDNVPTTLIVQSEERKLFELGSYADLLLLLNNYWLDRTVYFSIIDVKKINGFIEFQAYLIAYNTENEISDIAEIQFHLDEDFRIDLIMMILHPNAEF